MFSPCVYHSLSSIALLSNQPENFKYIQITFDFQHGCIRDPSVFIETSLTSKLKSSAMHDDDMMHYWLKKTLGLLTEKGIGSIPALFHRCIFDSLGVFASLIGAFLQFRFSWKLIYTARTRLYTEKTILPIPFTLNGIWSWWQFSSRFWTKWNSIWFKIEKKTVPTIISHPIWK